MSSCPPLEQLEQLLEEQLDEVAQRSVALHVTTCKRCQETLEHLTEETAAAGPLSSIRGRSAPGRQTSSDSPQTPFLSRLKRMFPLAPPGPARADGHDDSVSRSAAASLPAVAGYEILRELGRGGMGVVYQARQLALNRQVALKMILAGSHAGPKDLVRFRQEAEAVARLRHPNIVQIYDVGESEGRQFLALEYVEEGSLVQRLHGDPQPVEEAAALIETLARAVHHAHQQGIVHRDLKPANILLSSPHPPGPPPPLRGEGGAETFSPPPSVGEGPGVGGTIPKITDFGLAKRLDDQASGTGSGELVGTPSYMAPEQAAGKGRQVGPAADVYALGAILYEMLTGRPPFKGATPVDTVVQVLHEEPVRPGRLRPGLAHDLETICLKCLGKEPGRRYPSALALADDLFRFRKGKPIQARPVGALERAWKWARRRPLTAGLLAGIVLITILGFTAVAWQLQETALARDAAVDERQGAERARADAEKAQRRAGTARERARDALYYSRIAQSQLQWRVNDLRGAHKSLAKCLPAGGRTDRRGWEWYYLQGLFHADLFTFRHAHGGTEGGVVFHPQGRWIASVVGGASPRQRRQTGEVRIWDAVTGKLLHALPGPGTLNRLAVGPRGDWLALGTTDGAVMLWDAATGKEILRRQLHEGMVAGIAFSPGGRQVASASWDQTVKIWDSASGKVLHELRGHKRRVQSVAFHPDGKRLASGGWDAAVRVWNICTRKEIMTLRGHKGAVYCVAFSPDGRRLASAGLNGNIKLWDMASGEVVQSLTGHAGAVLSVAFSPDGRYLAYSGGDSTVRVWDVEAGVERINFRGHSSSVEGVYFSPDGQRLVSFSPARGIVKVWDLTRHPEYATFARTGTDLEAIAFDEKGKHLVSVTVGGKLQTWDAATGLLQDERSLPMSDEVVTPAVPAAFSPGGRRLADRSREDARLVKAWDVASGAEAVVFRGHALPVTCVRFSADGGRLATCAGDTDAPGRPHEIKVWDALTGKALVTLAGRGRIFNVAFSPDGRRLALGAESGALLVDLSAPHQRLLLAGHKGSVTAIAFSPNGKLLASAGLTDRLLKVWNVAALGRAGAAAAPPAHTLAAPGFLCDLAFSPNGRRLAGVSRDLVKMWDVRTGDEVLTLRGAPQRHWDPPFNPRVLFSPDGKRLVGTNWDESISIWDAEVQTDEARVARHQAARRAAADQRALFWHLQEAEVCLEHNNLSAALFHFRRLRQAPLPRTLQVRKDRLAARLQHRPAVKKNGGLP